MFSIIWFEKKTKSLSDWPKITYNNNQYIY